MSSSPASESPACPETQRLEALRQYRQLDTAAEQDFDELTSLAADLCATPVALISLVDEHRLWLKSRVGWSGAELAREASFCGSAILEEGTLIVEDTLLDPRFRSNPLVIDTPRVRFYAGAPLVTPEGHAIGALCVLDYEPRKLDAIQVKALAVLGRQVMAHLELRRHRAAVGNSEVQLESVSRNARKLRSLIDGFGPDVFVGMLTPDGVLIEANRSALHATGLTVAEAIGKPFDALDVWAYSPTVQAQLRSAIAKAARGQPSRFDVVVRGARGEMMVVDLSLHPVRDEAGNIEFLVPSAVVITERRRAEEHVRQLNRVYAVLSETNENILRQQDRPSMLRAACEIAVARGRFEMAWIGLQDDPEERLRVAAHAGASADTLEILRLLIDGDSQGCQFTFHALRRRERGVCNDIRNDPRAASWRDAALERGYGSMASFPLKVRGSVVGTFNLYAREPEFFNDEELRLLDELALDISFGLEIHEREAERRSVELALRESEERFREIAENIQEVFWMTDPVSRRVVYVSPAFEKVWGRTAASIYEVPRIWLEAIHPEDREVVTHAHEMKYATGDFAEVYRIVRPDGAVRWIRDRAFPVRGPNRDILHFVGTAEDITDQRHLEEQLRQAQKLEAIGQLAGGVAHDFNNILTIIRGFGSLLMMEKLSAEGQEATQAIIDAAERAANLTRQLLAFGRRQVMQPRNLDLNEIILGLTAMLQRIVGEDVRICLNLFPGPLMTRVDGGMLDQVLLNLVVNARDAMPGGGELRIETFKVEPPDVRPLFEENTIPQRQVGLRVVDSGVGIPQENLAHIFEPFFTTKGPGKGTGLGLATVYGIVTQHRGTVEVRSTIGIGTTIEVLLPSVDVVSQVALPGRVLGVSSRGDETVLVVEDDPHVRALTKRILEQQGYRVLEARHGPDAIRVWEREGAHVDLVLTDMVMPEGMGGLELARRLRERRATLKVIYMSGYSPETAGRELSDREREHFIQKPVAPAEMLATLRRCLDEKPSV